MTHPAPASAADAAHRVIMLLPTRRDAEVTRRLLESVGVSSVACANVREVAAEIRSGVGALLLTDLAVARVDADDLVATVHDQPPWSDIPILLLTPGRDASPAVQRLTAAVANVTLLDRPVWKRSLVSAVLAALRGRRRQYDLRDQIEAQRQAEEALRLDHRRKDEFLATLAHELRNPLAPLRTALQVLDRPQLEEATARRMHRMMGRQVDQLVKLIDDLLDISRVTTGKLTLQRERVDLRAVVDAAVETAQHAVEMNRHVLHVSMPDAPLVVVGDFTRLVQAVGNLLSNAVKYTPAGGRIDLVLERHEARAIVRVRDSGVGIPPDMLGRVFDMFTQISRTLDRAQGGLGIGLALVRRLIQMQGGTVRASSAGVDAGSEFVIELPVAAGSGGVEGEAAPAAREADPAPPGEMRVLVIDDNRDAADALAVMLADRGLAVRTEYGGAAGIRALHEFLPHVVICDVAMPGVDGYAVAAHVRGTPDFAGTLLVAHSGWGDAEHVRRARDAGFHLHLVKPAGMADVMAALASPQRE
jgi:signal transduction histidine kinase